MGGGINPRGGELVFFFLIKNFFLGENHPRLFFFFPALSPEKTSRPIGGNWTGWAKDHIEGTQSKRNQEQTFFGWFLRIPTFEGQAERFHLPLAMLFSWPESPRSNAGRALWGAKREQEGTEQLFSGWSLKTPPL